MRKVFIVVTLALCLGLVSVGVPSPASAGPEQTPQIVIAQAQQTAPAAGDAAAKPEKKAAPTRVEANRAITITMFLIIIADHPVHRSLGSKTYKNDGGLLRGAGRYYRNTKWMGHRWRLHVCSLIPRDCRTYLSLWI